LSGLCPPDGLVEASRSTQRLRITKRIKQDSRASVLGVSPTKDAGISLLYRTSLAVGGNEGLYSTQAVSLQTKFFVSLFQRQQLALFIPLKPHLPVGLAEDQRQRTVRIKAGLRDRALCLYATNPCPRVPRAGAALRLPDDDRHSSLRTTTPKIREHNPTLRTAGLSDPTTTTVITNLNESSRGIHDEQSALAVVAELVITFRRPKAKELSPDVLKLRLQPRGRTHAMKPLPRVAIDAVADGAPNLDSADTPAFSLHHERRCRRGLNPRQTTFLIEDIKPAVRAAQTHRPVVSIFRHRSQTPTRRNPHHILITGCRIRRSAEKAHPHLTKEERVGTHHVAEDGLSPRSPTLTKRSLSAPGPDDILHQTTTLLERWRLSSKK
jgi:hypothetical protein